MKILDVLDKEAILIDLKAKDKIKVIEELAEVIVKHKPNLDKDPLVRVLLERERLGSTAIGDGVAIPHGKYHGLSEPIISFGRSLKGLDFDSMDGQPVYLFFLLIAPESSASIHLKALARIAKILKNSSFRKLLMEVPTRKEIYEAIIQNDDEL